MISSLQKHIVLFCAAVALLASCKDSGSPASPVLKVRKNATTLTAEEKKDFVDAVLKLKTMPSPYDTRFSYYDQFVAWHVEAFRCYGGAQMAQFPAHMGPGFLPWHRQFLIMFEEALSKAAGKPMSLPYWDWTEDGALEKIFSDSLMGGFGSADQDYAVATGPFRKGNWTVSVFESLDVDSLWSPVDSEPDSTAWLVRAFGQGTSYTMPTPGDVELALSMPYYDVEPYDATSDTTKSFRNVLEGWRGITGMVCDNEAMSVVSGPGRRSTHHNVVHVLIGGVFTNSEGKDKLGTMAQSASPNDPVFFLHHANIDRLWTIWMTRHGKAYAPTMSMDGHGLYDAMKPYSLIGLTVRPVDMLDSKTLGYKYDKE